MTFDFLKAIIAAERRAGRQFRFSDAVKAFFNELLDKQLSELSEQQETFEPVREDDLLEVPNIGEVVGDKEASV